MMQHVVIMNIRLLIIKDDAGRTIDERKLEEYKLPDTFVIDLVSIKNISQQLASVRGLEGYIENVTASIAWHIAVASQLCGKRMPIVQLNVS